MTLLHVADAAYPFDLSKLPADVHHVAGYIGGDTPHVWSAAEIGHVHAKLGPASWWAIWTAPNSRTRPLTADDGRFAATATHRALNALRYSTHNPVFLDIERAMYDASPGGARACADAWRSTLHNLGRPNAHTYCAVIGDWLPDWTGHRPATLPHGMIGQQYASDKQLSKPFDLSVFDPKILAAPAPPATPGLPDGPVTWEGVDALILAGLRAFGLGGDHGPYTRHRNPDLVKDPTHGALDRIRRLEGH